MPVRNGRQEGETVKGVVLAGGSGTRMRPLTFARQKQTLPVGPTSLLERAIHRLREASVTDVAVVVGEADGPVRSSLGDGSAYGVDLTYAEQGEPRGLAHAIGCCEGFVGDEPFVVHFGDTVFERPIAPLVDAFDPEATDALLGVFDVSEPDRCSIVETDDDGFVTRAHEKPDDPPGTLSPIVDVFTPRIFEASEGLTPSERGELEIMDAIGVLADDGRVGTLELDGWWVDAGTPERLLRANRLVLDQFAEGASAAPPVGVGADERGVVADGARIEDGADVEPPVVVGSGARVAGTATVGPYAVLGEDVRVTDATVRNSVVLPGAVVDGTPELSRSIVGEDATVSGGNGRVELLVCDESRVRF